MTRGGEGGRSKGDGGGIRAEADRRLAGACRPCVEAGSDLQAERLCPCLIAFARRCLEASARSGDDPAALGPTERGALHLQGWAATSLRGVVETEPLEEVRAVLGASHPDCSLPGCLGCSARQSVEHALAASRCTVGPR